MPTFGKNVVWSGALAVALAVGGTARAQGTGGQDPAQAAMAACNVDENTTSAVQKAVLFWTDAYNSSGDSLKALNLQHAGKALTDPTDHNMSNLPGKAWELGRVAVSWLALDSQKVVTTRGQLGFVGGDTSAKVDLTVLVDSSFKVVEAALPKCIPIVHMYREQNGWYKLIQLALNENNNAGNLPPNDTAHIRITYDSALTTIGEAARMSTRSPYIGLVRGQIDQWKNDIRAAVADYQDAIAQTHLAANDTLYDPVRRQIYEAEGKLTLDEADRLTGSKLPKDSADRVFYLQTAKEAFSALAKEPGTSGGKIAADGLTAVAIQTGDTASITASYLSTLNNPDASYLDLIKAGFAANTAAEAERTTAIKSLTPASTKADTDRARNAGKEATYAEIKLFRKAGDVNPWGRDWLFNGAVVLATADSGLSARPLIDRLMIVDPAGYNNYQAAQTIYSYVANAANAKARHYAEIANSYNKPADAAKNKAYADTVKIWEDSNAVFAKRSTDFLFKKDSVYVGVELTGWVAKDGSVQMAGTMRNLSPTAKNVVMHVEFLDHDGKTVSTADVPTTALAPKGSDGAAKDFTLTGTGAGILAFKYTLQY